MKRRRWMSALLVMAACVLGSGFCSPPAEAGESLPGLLQQAVQVLTQPAGAKVVLPRYPDLKIGITTANLLNFMPVSVANAKKYVDFAVQHGFVWIELRDPAGVLTLADCEEIAAYARQRGIEVGYAVMVGLLDPNFWEVFSRTVANSAVFGGPRTVRTAAPGLEFATNEKKTAWTFGEFATIVKHANQAANYARMFGLTYAVENAWEPLKGDGVTTFGTTELFANANANLALQLDTANFFVTSRVPARPEAARDFFEKFAPRLAYMHVKTATKEGKPAPVLGDNPLIFEIPFWQAVKYRKPYVAIELPAPKTLDDVSANHKKSVQYLLENF